MWGCGFVGQVCVCEGGAGGGVTSSALSTTGREPFLSACLPAWLCSPTPFMLGRDPPALPSVGKPFLSLISPK